MNRRSSLFVRGASVFVGFVSVCVVGVFLRLSIPALIMTALVIPRPTIWTGGSVKPSVAKPAAAIGILPWCTIFLAVSTTGLRRSGILTLMFYIVAYEVKFFLSWRKPDFNLGIFL